MRQCRGIARESLITLKLVFSYSICSRPHSSTYCYSSLLLVSQLLTMDVRQLFPVLGRRRNFCRCCCLAVVISIGTLVVTSLLPEYYSCQCLVKGYFILSSFWLIESNYITSEIQRMLLRLPVGALKRYEIPELKFPPCCSQSYRMHYRTIFSYIVTHYFFHSRVENVMCLPQLPHLSVCSLQGQGNKLNFCLGPKERVTVEYLCDSYNAEGPSQLTGHWIGSQGRPSLIELSLKRGYIVKCCIAY